MKSPRLLISFGIMLILAAVYFILSANYLKSEEKPVLKKVEIVSGNAQSVLPDSAYPLPLTVKSVDQNGEPIKNLPIEVRNIDGADLSFDPASTVTDAGGIARFKVRAGKVTGDNYLLIIPQQNNALAIKARFVNGAIIIGADQEGAAGSTLDKPIGVKLAGADGKPISGAAVYIRGSEDGAAPQQSELTTGADGIAATTVKLPEKSGSHSLEIEILPAGNTGKFRALQTRVLAIDVTTIVITVLGGLALFMLGMTMMSDGLAAIAGEKMKGVLRFCTQNRVMALIAGTAVTAIIQSSSASTVMVIGFVNAGLISLAQSIGVIFGANIGTTVTAQIVAFDIGALALPAIVLGLILKFIKKGKLPDVGTTVLGFGLLFFGMNMMSAELKSLSDFPSFINFFRTFDCAPVDGQIPVLKLVGALLIGLIATVIMQSSSATTGVVVILGAGGLINLYTAVVLIFGANIGTTITAQLAAIPANRPARQAALAHTLFNVLGVVFALASFWIPWGKTGIPVFFYLVNLCTEGNAFAPIPENLPRHIANAHTIFNVATSLVLLPFSHLLAKCCEKLIPIRENKIQFQYLEPHLLDSPALALRQTVFALGKMLKKSCRMVDSAVNNNFILGQVDENKMSKFNNREERVDRYQSDIMEYLAQIMRRKLTPHQAEIIPQLMHCANDAERIADRAANIIDLTRRLEAENMKLSRQAISELEELFETLNRQMSYAHNALESSAPEWMDKALRAEKDVNRMAAGSEAAHIQRMKSEKCTPQAGIIYVELLSELVAVSRHLSNIAERVVNA